MNNKLNAGAAPQWPSFALDSLGRRGFLSRLMLLAGAIAYSSVGSSPPTLSPLVQISTPDPLAACTISNLPDDANVEPMIAINPLSPGNIVVTWMAHGTSGIGCSTSLDGGSTWANQAIPNLTICSGGTEPLAADPWVSFSPNGTLYATCGTFGLGGGAPFVVVKSSNGGLNWGLPLQLNTLLTSQGYDKPSLTADAFDSRYAYVAWVQFNKNQNGNNAQTIFTRTVDGGQTWQPPQSIHSSSSGDFEWGHEMVVMPDGTLVCAFCEGSFQNNHQAALTLMRSSDHGQSWSGPFAAPPQKPLVDANSSPPAALVTDPDTGCAVAARPMFDSIAVDRNSGNLYAVWIDARFSNSAFNSIALSVSTDGGLNWSDPIQVNQTPKNLPAAEQQAWKPTVAVADDGTVGVSYYDFRNNTPAAGCLTDYWLAYWRPSSGPINQAANWNEVRLTDTSFDLEQAAPDFFGACYLLGDYEGLASTGNGLAAVWTQPYAGTHDQIFFRKITFQVH